MSDEGTMDGRLSAGEERALAAVLDEIIPASGDGRFPGAGEVGVAATVAGLVRDIAELRTPVLQGLATLAALAARRSPEGFASLAPHERRAVLDELAATDAAFLPTMTFLAYVGYYKERRVLEALGLPARPPHPQGHEVKPNDLTILAPVRARPKMFRRC
jgi:hypothetical protein